MKMLMPDRKPFVPDKNKARFIGSKADIAWRRAELLNYSGVEMTKEDVIARLPIRQAMRARLRIMFPDTEQKKP